MARFAGMRILGISGAFGCIARAFAPVFRACDAAFPPRRRIARLPRVPALDELERETL